MRELQYLLLEAFSNVMQHADSGVVQVVARSVGGEARGGGAILIEIRDDGCGSRCRGCRAGAWSGQYAQPRGWHRRRAVD
ncbi:ATP-binding protein [Cupriavidus basilensis]